MEEDIVLPMICKMYAGIKNKSIMKTLEPLTQ